MDDWRKEREQRRLELAAELRGDMSKEEEDELHARLREKEMLSESLKSKSEERSTKGEVLEQAFNEIRQATGVNTLDQMVQKFMGQVRRRIMCDTASYYTRYIPFIHLYCRIYT